MAVAAHGLYDQLLSLYKVPLGVLEFFQKVLCPCCTEKHCDQGASARTNRSGKYINRQCDVLQGFLGFSKILSERRSI